MKWLFSPGIPSPPSSTVLDLPDENVTIKKRLMKNWKTLLPIAILVVGCLGLAANKLDFKSSKDTESSGVKAQNTKDWNNIGDGTPYEETKLSDAFIPEKYKLDLEFSLKEKSWTARDQEYEWEDTFRGKVSINMTCKKQTYKIELNALNLTFDMDTLKVTVGKKDLHVPVVFGPEPETGKWIFIFDTTFFPGDNVVMTFSYTGLVFSNSMEGVYKTKYDDINGKQRSTLATQFAPQNARKMVPCFDEPDKKATWKINVTCPTNFTILSNAPLLYQYYSSDGLKTIEFHESPIMSSYLLAVVVGHLSSIHDTKNAVIRKNVGVYGNAPAGKQQMEYALEIAVKCLPFMEKYTNIVYWWKKLDLVALSDFEAGAMENFGLITFRQSRLFYDPRYYPKLSRAVTAKIINHEIAHQWFGNIVTLKDWQYTWLNEGFARFYEHFILSAQEPEFGTLEENCMKIMDKAMAYDAMLVSHPLTYKLTSAQEISYNFNTISYDKGASIIWMVRQLMTPEAFDDAIRDYLWKKQNSNAVPQDLFDALNRHVPADVLGPDGRRLDVEFFLRQYTEQSGVPLVTVTRLNPRQLKLSQSRYRDRGFFKDLDKYAKPEFGFKWDVPIWYHDGKDLKFVWLKRDEDLLIESESPIILNAEGTMYYKFQYDREEFLKFVSNVTLLEDFPVETVNKMLKTVLDFLLLDTYQTQNLFEFSKNLVRQRSPRLNVLRNVWTNLLRSSSSYRVRQLAGRVDDVLSYPNVVGNKKKSLNAKSFAVEVSQKFQVASKSNSLEKYEEMVEEVKECGDSCLEEIVDKYQGNFSCKEPSERTSECSTISAEYRGLFYCHMMTREPKAHQVLLNYYKNEIVEKEKMHLLEGLLCTNDKDHIKFWLDRVIDLNDYAGVHMRVQDLSILYQRIAQNPTGRTMILDYFINNWKSIHKRLENNLSTLNRLVVIVAKVIATRMDYHKFDGFIKNNPETQNMMVFRESLEMATTAVGWNNRYVEEMIKYFS